MDLQWQEEQRAFQTRVLTDEDPDLGLRADRTFLGCATLFSDRRASRRERLVLMLVMGAMVVSLLLALGAPREIAALTASLTGGLVVVTALSADHSASRSSSPLMAVYSHDVSLGEKPVCVTRISVDERMRLGSEGFGTIVGDPRPGATFGLFVDDHLVWPRTPPRAPLDHDPRFGDA